MRILSRTFGVSALVLLLLVCLAATAPARLLSLVLPSGQVSAQGFSGTLWQGKVSRCLVKTPAGYLHLGSVKWRLEPFSLLLFAPRLALESSWGNQSLATELVLRGSQDADLYHLEASVPADLLRQFVPVNLTGVFSAQLAQLKLRDGMPVEGEGRLVWQDGAWSAPNGPVPLGSYALEFKQPQGAALAGQVVTIAGVVNAEGTVRLSDRAYAIDIEVSSEGGLDERLQQALSLVARPSQRGYRIKLEGQVQESL